MKSIDSSPKPHLAVFLATSGHSGVDRVMNNLLPAIADRGIRVDLLHIENHGPTLRTPHELIRVIPLGTRHVNTSLPALLRYLRRERPQVVLADKDKVNRLAIVARLLGHWPRRVVVRMGTTVSKNLEQRSAFNRWTQYASIRLFYRFADALITPSQGAAQDLARIAGLPVSRVSVVPSPVINAEFGRQISEPVSHRWLNSKEVPVILGVGELSLRKDFATLVRAFALLRAERAVKLIILGKGRERDNLLRLLKELGVEDDVDLAGFQTNPYGFMARADVFALTSICEGSPVALMEAMAAGIPSVATDCPSGPMEILDGGRLGYLAPVGDHHRVYLGLKAMLDQPPDAAVLRAAAQRYSLQASTDSYLQALGLRGSDDAA